MIIPDYNDERLLFGMLIKSANKLQVIGDRLFEEITMKQWFVLAMLEVFREEDPTLNELATMVGSSHQNVKQLILKLQEKGYVDFYEDPKDKRKRRIKATGKWKEVEVKYTEKEETHMKAIFQGVDPRALNDAVQVMLQITKNLEEMKSDE